MKYKLNIGSGYKRIQGFLNLDSDKHCNPDYLVDLENAKFEFEDNSVDYIVAHHILEHVGEGFIPLLKEMYRVCDNNAIIDIRVPHMNHDVAKIDPTHKRFLTVETFRLFSKKYNQEEIKRGGSSSTLGIMNDIDFEIIENEYVLDGYYDSILPILQPDVRERLGREANNVCIEEHFRLRVVK